MPTKDDSVAEDKARLSLPMIAAGKPIEHRLMRSRKECCRSPELAQVRARNGSVPGRVPGWSVSRHRGRRAAKQAFPLPLAQLPFQRLKRARRLRENAVRLCAALLLCARQGSTSRS